MSRRQTPPIIILGMHRSGTTMVTRLLGALGLFVGRNLERNAEPRLLKMCNDWMLRQASGRWDNPEPIEHLLSCRQGRSFAVEYLRGLTASPPIATYMGLWRYLRYRCPANLPGPWGFKDPRTTFTLPIWRDVFGDVRVIHIVRHGVDVAQSLVTRTRGLLAVEQSRMARYRRWHWWKRGGFADTVCVRGIAEGVDLWDRYVTRGREHVDELGDDAIEMKFEQILADPLQTMTALARFAGLDPAPEAVRPLVRDVRANRAFAYRNDPDLSAAAETAAATLGKHGY